MPVIKGPVKVIENGKVSEELKPYFPIKEAPKGK